jgi:isopentenyl-diphosphate delta-isomerase
LSASCGPATEEVVLLAPDGTPCGVAEKATVHGVETPYHLAFSLYAFDPGDRLLVTRRAVAKATWPGIWTNSCCGHPGPGELADDAVVRRLAQELGLVPRELTLALPDFSYRASFRGVEEHELCPVYLCRVDSEPVPDPSEVAEVRWQSWADYAAAALTSGSEISPWSREQVRRLVEGGHVDRFLATT